MKKLAIFDVDNTITSGFSQGLFVDYLYKKGRISFFQKLVIIMWFILYKIGIVKNPKVAMEYGLGFIKNKSVKDIQSIVDDFFYSVWVKKIYPDIEKIIKNHQENGRIIIIVSNAPDVLVRKLASHLRIEDIIATSLEVKDNVYTGKIFGEIIYGKKKIDKLNDYISERGFSLKNSWGYGDHETDSFFLSAVSNASVVNPSKSFKDVAVKNNWNVILTKI